MIRIQRILALALVAVSLVAACSDDDPTSPPPVNSDYQNLTQREHVLQNLQTAYNQRNLAEYDKLLDDNFVFFFDLGNVGGNIPVQWDRLTDLNTTRNMFNPGYTGPNPITAIDLTLEGLNKLVWLPVKPTDPMFDGETWYVTTVTYNFNIQAQPEITYIQSGSPKAQFTVRSTYHTGRTTWHLVQWRDITDSGLRVQVVGSSARGTEESSWGSIKSLYQE